MIAKGDNEDKILQELEREDFYQADYVHHNFQQTLSELIKRETETDLKISKFIKDNYQYIRLFHTPNHPTNVIGFNLANQILVKLGMEPISQIYSPEKFANYQLPIYHSIIKLLNLKFVNENNKYTVTFSDKQLNFKDYIKAYTKQYIQKSTNKLKMINNSQYETKSFHKEYKKMKLRTLGKLSTKLSTIERKSIQQSRLFTIDLIPYIQRLFYHVPHGTIIDVLDVGIHNGAGTGLLAELHNKQSYNHLKMNVTGLDINENFQKYIELCYPSFKFIKQDIFKIPEDKTWDLVICSHVIQCLSDPISFIKQLRRLTSKYAIVACPYNETDLRKGHVQTIDNNFISRLNPLEYHVYTNFCWRTNGECVIMIFESFN